MKLRAALIRAQAHPLHQWLDRWVPVAWLVGLLCLAIPFDIWIDLTGHGSISQRCWGLGAAHPTIAQFFNMVGLWIIYFCRRNFVAVATAGVATGHCWWHL